MYIVRQFLKCLCFINELY